MDNIKGLTEMENENSAFPTLVTARGNNKLIMDQCACLFLFSTSSNSLFNTRNDTSAISVTKDSIPKWASLVVFWNHDLLPLHESFATRLALLELLLRIMLSSFCVVFREWTMVFLLDLLSRETQLIHEGLKIPDVYPRNPLRVLTCICEVGSVCFMDCTSTTGTLNLPASPGRLSR